VNANPRFLEIDEVLYFHGNEIKRCEGSVEIRDIGALESALAAPKATFAGEYLLGNLFEMAATYANSICFNHPFLDGNKRTAALSALAFLYFNGYECYEEYEEEIADKILALVTKEINKEELAEYFRTHSKKVL